MCSASRSNGKGLILVFVTTQCKGGKNVAPTYLFWRLDSKKIWRDVVYYDLIFIVCVSLERPGGQFRLKGESCIMFNIVPTKSDFFKFRCEWGLQLGNPPPTPALGAALHETLLWMLEGKRNGKCIYSTVHLMVFLLCLCNWDTCQKFWNYSTAMFSNFQHWLRPLVLN